MNYSDTQISEFYGQLPKTLQDYISSKEVLEKIDQIMAAWEITEEELFRTYVLLLLMGVWSMEDFSQAAEVRLNLHEEQINELILAIDGLLLQDARQIAYAAPENEPIEPEPVQPTSAVITPTPEVVHTLDLEIPPHNLPMIETEEERHQFLKNIEFPAASKAEPVYKATPRPLPERPQLVKTPEYKESFRKLMESQQNTMPKTAPSTQFQNAILEPHLEQPPHRDSASKIPHINPVSLQSQKPKIPESEDHFPPKSESKFSYHDRDPYREPPEP